MSFRTWGRKAFDRRRRYAPLVLVLAVVVVGNELWSGMPRNTRLEYRLGPDHARVVEMRVVYVQDGEEIRGVSFHYPEGAPPRVAHQLELPSGHYEVSLELTDRDGKAVRVTRALRTPAEGVVRVDAPAARGMHAR
jgi:hypothetical protein